MKKFVLAVVCALAIFSAIPANASSSQSAVTFPSGISAEELKIAFVSDWESDNHNDMAGTITNWLAEHPEAVIYAIVYTDINSHYVLIHYTEE